MGVFPIECVGKMVGIEREVSAFLLLFLRHFRGLLDQLGGYARGRAECGDLLLLIQNYTDGPHDRRGLVASVVAHMQSGV